MIDALRIHPGDDVAVALTPLACGESALGVTLLEHIPAGHKFALAPIAKDSEVRKYGLPIGRATADIPVGAWVHTHNVRTGLVGQMKYDYTPTAPELAARESFDFAGYVRADGRAGIRNELWIIPTVGCVNDICRSLQTQNAQLAERFGLDGVYHFPHPYGCSQMGDDHAATRTILAALCRHPNAGGVLVVGLGCENNRLEDFKALFSAEYAAKLRFMSCQEEPDELAAGSALLEELARYAAESRRESIPASKLVVGMKCGGSNGLSGITANPVVGAFSDMLVAVGGTTILTEVPEMFGAEQLLFDRCNSGEVFSKATAMVNGFKEYFTSHGQTVYENPSPGNKDGGITTLEDKSIGCVQKSGFAPVVDVLQYGEPVTAAGLNLLCGPGNDLVSATALTAAGAQLVLFTTGLGTPFGAPAPTLKISSNSALYEKKPHWIDFNAGTVATGEPIAAAAARLLDLVRAVADGRQMTHNEESDQRGIAIWKNGVTL